MPSRAGPRKPGHSAGLIAVVAGGVSVLADAAGGVRSIGLVECPLSARFSEPGMVAGALAISGAAGPGEAAGAGGGALTASVAVRASRRSSAVFDHRHVSCDPNPLTPSVRKSV